MCLPVNYFKKIEEWIAIAKDKPNWRQQTHSNPRSPESSLSLVNTLPITKKNKHTVVTEAPKKYMCCFRASKVAPEGQFRLQLASFLRTNRRD